MFNFQTIFNLILILGIFLGLCAGEQAPKCLLPMDAGPCRMALDRFYYNSKTKTCEQFKFGGCKGNDNKFGFKKTCEDECVQANWKPPK